MSKSTDVCMNPRRPCSSCIFNEGHLSRWCKQEEREAKAQQERSLQVQVDAIEIAAVLTV